MWQSVKVLNVFNTLTLIQIFWKTKTFFKKMEYRFLVETTTIENTSFPFKTALLEANVKTNRMATTKWTYHKEWSLASFCLFSHSLNVILKFLPIFHFGLIRKLQKLHSTMFLLNCFEQYFFHQTLELKIYFGKNIFFTLPFHFSNFFKCYIY